MVLEIADNPHASVNEEQHPRRSCHLLRRHDVELHSAPVLADRLFNGGHTGHVDRRLVLQRRQDPGVWAAAVPKMDSGPY